MPDTANRKPAKASAETSSERLVLFTDAVAAIAITLLVLPLVDLVPEAAKRGGDVGDLLRDNRAQISAFILSFVVIARLWWAHHQIFRHVEIITWRLVTLSMLWTFTIVVLPLPTATLTAYRTGPETILLYVGTLIVSNLALTLISLELYRRPDLSGERSTIQREGVLGIALSLASFVVALVLGLTVPGVGFWGLLLNAFTGIVAHPIHRHWARQDEARRATTT